MIVKNEFDVLFSREGASGVNAFTSEDMTAYFDNVPANKLELWMWMESERIFHPVFREFYAERDVVFEERRMRTESTPLGKFEEEFNAMFWESSPYSWPTLGWPSDIPSISKAQADEFYATYYCPQNITLILVGDFKTADAEAMAKKYFERIPRGKKTPPDVVDAGSEATRGETHVCGGGHESRRWIFSGTRCRSATRIPTRCKSWGRFYPRAPGGFTRISCSAAAWRPSVDAGPGFAEMGGLFQSGRRSEGGPQAGGGGTRHLR